MEVQDGACLSVGMLTWEGCCLKEKRRLLVDKPGALITQAFFIFHTVR